MSTDPYEVTPARAALLAAHAIHVQGGFSTPEIEAERARKDMERGGPIDWDRFQRELDAALLAKVAALPEALPDPQPVGEAQPAVKVYTPRKGSKVEQLHALYAEAKAAKAAAEKQIDAITAAIKSELDQHRDPDDVSIDFVSPAGPPLRMTWVVTNRFDAKAFEKAYPALKAEFTKPSGSWRLAEIKDES